MTWPYDRHDRHRANKKAVTSGSEADSRQSRLRGVH